MKINKKVFLFGAIALALVAQFLVADDSLLALVSGKKIKKAIAAKKMSVQAKNQKMTNGRIKIKKVEVSGPSFLVAHRPEDAQKDLADQRAGKLGTTVCRAIGISGLLTGKSSNVSISIGGGFSGGSVNLMLHRDTNGNGQFDHGIDLPVAESAREISVTQ